MGRFDDALKQVEQARLALRPTYADSEKKNEKMEGDKEIDLVHAKILHKLM
jgi:hypothetical protein